MAKPLKATRIVKWQSRLGPGLCPYANRMAIGRWFFYSRLDAALRCAGPRPHARVLDLGCWEGYFLPSLLQMYGNIWAIDNDSASLLDRLAEPWTILQVARDLCRAEGVDLHNLHLAKADGGRLPFRDASFDVVFCLDSLPYVPGDSHHNVVAEIQRVLKAGGVAIVSLPIEVGPALLVREVLRRSSGSWMDGYSLKELVGSVLYKPAPERKREEYNLVGYDYRKDVRLIESFFAIERQIFLPWNWTRWFSPTVVLSCAATG